MNRNRYLGFRNQDGQHANRGSEGLDCPGDHDANDSAVEGKGGRDRRQLAMCVPDLGFQLVAPRGGRHPLV